MSHNRSRSKKKPQSEWNNQFNSNWENERGERPDTVSDDEETAAFKERFRKQQYDKQNKFRNNKGKAPSKSPVKKREPQDNNIEYFQVDENVQKEQANAVINNNKQQQQQQQQSKKEISVNNLYGIAIGDKQHFKINNQGDKFQVLQEMTHLDLQNLLNLNPNDVRRIELNKAIKQLGLNYLEVQSNYEIQQIILSTINGPPGWKRIQFEDNKKVVYWDMKKHQQTGIPDSGKVNKELQALKDKYAKLKAKRIKPDEQIKLIPRPAEKPKVEKKKKAPEPVKEKPKPKKIEEPPKEEKKVEVVVEDKFIIDGPIAMQTNDDGGIVTRTQSYKVYSKFDFGPVDLMHNIEQKCDFEVQSLQDETSFAVGMVQKNKIKQQGYSIKYKVMPEESILMTSDGWLCLGGEQKKKIDGFQIKPNDNVQVSVNLSEKTIVFENLTSKKVHTETIPQKYIENNAVFSITTVHAHSYDKTEIKYQQSKEEEWNPLEPQKPRYTNQRKVVEKNKKDSGVLIKKYGQQKAKDLDHKKYVNTQQCDDEKELDQDFNYKNVKLGKKEAFEDFNIICGVFHEGTNFQAEFEKNMQILKEFGFNLTFEKNVDDFSEKISTQDFDIALVIASMKFEGDEEKFVNAVKKFTMEDKKSLYIGGDNDPYYIHANVILQKLFGGMSFTSDYIGSQIIYAGDKADMSHFDRNHSMAYGINNFYEGNTICHPINIHPDFQVFAFNSEDNPLVMYAEQNKTHGRVVLDCGFTRAYDMFWKMAGTEKLMANIVIWLSGIVE